MILLSGKSDTSTIKDGTITQDVELSLILDNLNYKAGDSFW